MKFKSAMWVQLGVVAFFASLTAVEAQVGGVNRAPHFLPNGDMFRFAVPEDTPPGTPVYKLLGSDPEDSKVFYSISGDYFTVDKDTGIVSTLKAFDREKEDIVKVVISVTDESTDGSEPNTVSLLREIPILDINDNEPVFYNRPYSFSLFENTVPGKILFDNITVEDKDGGINGDVILSCAPPGDETCTTFDITTEKIAEGQYKGTISLLKPLDYESRTSYSLTIKATDRARDPSRRLSSTANVIVNVLDIQDQPPVFINAPYSATVSENTEEGTVILRVGGRDGDVGDPRTTRLEIRNEHLGCFKLVKVLTDSYEEDRQISFYDIVTTSSALDRENPEILQSGGIYTFTLRAVELINSELPADFAETTVTIVITDVDDQLPVFSQESFHVNVSENIAADSPLPGLNMIVTDKDIGENAHYHLSLREVKNVKNTFAVQPTSGSGRTAVVVKVNDTANLDYDVDDDNLRTLVFDVVVGVANEYVGRKAYVEKLALAKQSAHDSLFPQNVVREVGKSRVFVYLEDANDNSPEFLNNSFYITVPENTAPDFLIHNLSATDRDSGVFGEIKYFLKGFGAHKFRTDSLKGGIYTTSFNLDHESQKSYTLNLVAVDGGNRTSSTTVYVDVEDLNDNKPNFELKEYNRIIRESATSFQPEFYVRAVDKDGPTQGGGKIFYEIIEKNHENEVFAINQNTGELSINGRVASSDTPKGQYEMVVRGWDYGHPRLYEDVRVNVRVGVIGNQRPYFKGNVKNKNGVSSYRVDIREDAESDREIIKLEAIDPDGADSKLSYHIVEGGKDNFILNRTSGLLKTSPYSDFDLESNPRFYELHVIAIDAGSPVPETGSTSVVVNVKDVNNKPPYFLETAYWVYLNENAEVNSSVLTVAANDTDEDHEIAYTLQKPLKVYDKAGLLIDSYEDWFAVNNKTGEVLLNRKINHEIMNYIVFGVEAEDVKAANKEQKTTVEVTVYIQASNEKNPIFSSANWTLKNRVIKIKINEEMEKNSIVYTLKARDPVNNKTKIKYEATKNDHYNVFNVSENGNVIILRKLDYEQLTSKVYNISIRAIVNEDPYQDIKNMKDAVVDVKNLPKVRYTDSILSIEIVNVNDNAPVFEEATYTKRVLENIKYPEVIFTAKAIDLDNDRVSYSISGENSKYFVINGTTGEVMAARDVSLDREKRSFYKFNITATDKSPSVGTKIHKTTAQAVVEVLDVNDNPPVFGKDEYSTVIPENVDAGTTILRVQATDLDLGLSGEIFYQIIEESEALGFFKVDQETGEITTKKILTGKGRPEPYNIIIRASDKGDHVLDSSGKNYQKSLSSEVALKIYIGDVVKNDGVPVFTKPALNQMVKISENASVGTSVFQVIATDPDSANSAEGQIRYKFLDDGKLGEENPFKIHPESGLISTRLPLNREKKNSYDLIIVAEDRGEVPQQATRVLHVEVLDVDDHKPYFKRSFDESPIVMRLLEEGPIGSEVGIVQAFDEDVGENALIDYAISHGNDHHLFSVARTEDNLGVIQTAGRIDREKVDRHLLTLKCFKLAENEERLSFAKPYNRQDPSERQVLILVEDIDDNNPTFEEKNATIGVRLNVPPDTTLLTVRALDADENSAPMEYYIGNITFTNVGKYDRRTMNIMNATEKLFQIDARAGELRTGGSLQRFTNGFFDLAVYANNTPDVARRANMSLRVFMLRDKALMKFIFSEPPTEVKKQISELESAVAAALKVQSVNIYDTQFHSKKDGSLDFSSTSSCFQIVGKEPYGVERMERLLADPKNKDLKRVFSKFNIQEITRCAPTASKAETSWVEIWVLILSASVGVLTVVAALAITFLYSRYKKEAKRQLNLRAPSTAGYMSIRTSTQVVSPAGGSMLGSQLIMPKSQSGASQMCVSKSDRSALGSQILAPKGSQLMINEPATQMGSQLIINNPKTNFVPPQMSLPSLCGSPIIMGSSQMLVPNSTATLNEGHYEEQDRVFPSEDFSSQVMYEYIGDGAENMAFDDDS